MNDPGLLSSNTQDVVPWAFSPRTCSVGKARTHFSAAPTSAWWVPAFAGTTILTLALISALLYGLPAQAAQPAVATAAPSDQQIIHVLDRLAFGPTRDDVAHVRSVGVDHYFAEQLDPASIPENPELIERLAALGTVKLHPRPLFREYGPPP